MKTDISGSVAYCKGKINNKMGNNKINILIFIVAIVIIGLVIYFGITKYISYKTNKAIETKTAQDLQLQKDLEMEKLKQEVEILKNKKPDTIKQTIIRETPSSSSDSAVTSIINQWRPRVAYIDCKVLNSNNKEIGRQSGSGYVLGINDLGEVKILTNKHVINITIYDIWGEPTDIVITASSCDIKVPGDYSFATVQDEKGVFSVSPTEDFASINIKNPTLYMKQIINSNGSQMCKTKISLGEKILVLGYPGIGDQSDVTVTDGIVSGYDGNYYITSAKVEHGNSGGVAVSVKDNCYMGIPTSVLVGTVESLARILDIRTIFK